MACIICGGNQRDWLNMPLDPKKNEATRFGRVVRCQSCGLGAVDPLPRPEEVADLYRLDRYYTQGESHIAEVQPRLADRLLTALAWRADKGEQFDPDAAALPPGARALDIGCGPGHYLLKLKARGFEVLGIEPDPEARAGAARNGLQVLAGTAEQLPEKLGTFDLVIMSHSLEHCLDPATAVRNVFALMRPGGTFYCEVPNSACLHFRWFNICSEMFDAPRHLYFFSPSNLSALLEKAGFRIDRTLFNGFVRHHSPSWRAWEKEIAARVKRVEPNADVTCHGFARSVRLALATSLSPPAVKYDTFGLFAVNPS